MLDVLQKMNHAIIVAVLISITCTSYGEQVNGLLPTGEMTDKITSIEKAYPEETYVSRREDESSGVVSYEIRFFDKSLLHVDRVPNLWDIVLVVTDVEGRQLLAVPIDFSGVS